jgi:hypothetical protein
MVRWRRAISFFAFGSSRKSQLASAAAESSSQEWEVSLKPLIACAAGPMRVLANKEPAALRS